VDVVTGTLLILGFGFLVANARLLVDLLRFARRRKNAILTWLGPPPPYYLLTLSLGVATGVLVALKVWEVLRVPGGLEAVTLTRNQFWTLFGELMMFAYFGYMVPFTRRIARGFYEDGIWADSGFVPYNEVGGISWREGEHAVSLVVISRLRNLARRLAVPAEHYAAARRLLRDKIGDHEIHFSGTGLDLGLHDEREEA